MAEDIDERPDLATVVVDLAALMEDDLTMTASALREFAYAVDQRGGDSKPEWERFVSYMRQVTDKFAALMALLPMDRQETPTIEGETPT